MKRRLAGAAAAVALGVGTLLVGQPAQAAVVGCDTWTADGAAYGYCIIKSGQARMRADCKLAVDHYSRWEGVGTYLLYTTPCPWGIRGAIVEIRN
jgi:hypothetical protein